MKFFNGKEYIWLKPSIFEINCRLNGFEFVEVECCHFQLACTKPGKTQRCLELIPFV
jgi:hypothetical protein